MEVETLEREEYEAILKQQNVTIQDAYGEDKANAAAADPTKASTEDATT